MLRADGFGCPVSIRPRIRRPGGACLTCGGVMAIPLVCGWGR
ncbi:hypothetical protein DVS28_b0201 (plasmid) [Euzebya pacifica]|uniref:Uncharacterized protein n=1 Tax=Euzebya pacifica TaxID=1608957 RepID=A0A346Y674_9ACTN|nr:hypothetical protein DVS28_b0201 [Euzebya pacifica]